MIMNSKLIFSLLLASSLLGGCARMLTPQGDDKYDCNRKENPNSPYCHSFKAIDQATRNPLPVTRYDAVTNMNTVDQYTGVAPSSGATPPPNGTEKQGDPSKFPGRGTPMFYSTIQQSNGSVSEYAQRLPRDGAPIREVAPIQRVWVKKHRDSSDRLIGTTVVYAELGSNHWAGFDAVPGSRVNGASTGKQVFPHITPTPGVISKLMPAPQQGAGQTKNEFQQPGVTQAENLEQHPASEQMGETSLPQ